MQRRHPREIGGNRVRHVVRMPERPIRLRAVMLEAEMLFDVQRPQILRHIRRNGQLFVILAVHLKPPVQRPQAPPHIVRLLADVQPQRVHQRLIGIIAAASPAEPIRPEAPIHMEALAAPLARIAPAQPRMIPKRRFILRVPRIPANPRHRAPRPCIQLGVDELHHRRKLVAQFAHRPLDKALVARLIRRVKRLIVIEPNIVQEIQRLLRKALEHVRSFPQNHD